MKKTADDITKVPEGLTDMLWSEELRRQREAVEEAAEEAELARQMLAAHIAKHGYYEHSDDQLGSYFGDPMDDNETGDPRIPGDEEFEESNFFPNRLFPKAAEVPKEVGTSESKVDSVQLNPEV